VHADKEWDNFSHFGAMLTIAASFLLFPMRHNNHQQPVPRLYSNIVITACISLMLSSSRIQMQAGVVPRVADYSASGNMKDAS